MLGCWRQQGLGNICLTRRTVCFRIEYQILFLADVGVARDVEALHLSTTLWLGCGGHPAEAFVSDWSEALEHIGIE